MWTVFGPFFANLLILLKPPVKKRHPVQVALTNGISALLGHDEFISLITCRKKAKTLDFIHNVAERRRTK